METIRNGESPWLDIRLSEEIIDYLRSLFDNTTEQLKRAELMMEMVSGMTQDNENTATTG